MILTYGKDCAWKIKYNDNMKALIFNGSKDGDDLLRISQEAIETQLKAMGWQVDSLHLHEMDIAPCLGYFGCWVKTPGICVINDSGRAIPKKIVQSDLMIFLTPITFGGYSPELKKALDRSIPILLPFFKKVYGETHHVMEIVGKAYISRYFKCLNLLHRDATYRFIRWTCY